MRPVVSRFTEAFQFDPLRMISSGTLACTVPPGRVADAIHSLKDLGVHAFDVGWVTDGDGVVVRRGGKITHYREIRCEDDELARLWALYFRKIS
jgi:hydrogenase maturation factor